MYRNIYNIYVVEDLEDAGINVSAINYNNGELLVVVPTSDVDDAEAIVIDTLDAEGLYAEVVDRIADVNLTNLYFKI